MTSRQLRIPVSAAPGAVPAVRDRVLAQVTAWMVPLEPDQRDVIKLVTSELVTNSVVHGHEPITVGLCLDDSRLLLVVHDGSDEPPIRQAGATDEESGRGLLLVDALASRNGWSKTAHGKKVWAEFDLPVPAPPAQRSLAARRAEIARSRPHLYVIPHGLTLAKAP
ncbi:ATP-binding protein [Streptomyces violascens]|uniref:ATP-binding protein n=1 Tax=Streptomyces violascens TaxID=67381 RepID=UPI003666DB60